MARAEPSLAAYAVLSILLGLAVAGALVQYYGRHTIEESLRATLRIAPPPLPGIPAGEIALRAIGLTLIALMAPLAAYSRRLITILDTLDTLTISLIRDVLGLLRSGYTAHEAVAVLATRDYGPLNGFTRRLKAMLESNYTFEEAFSQAVKGLPRFTTAMLYTLLDAYQAGGRALELAASLSSVFASVASLEDLRRSAMRAYIYMLGIAVLMFAAVAGATIYLASALQAQPQGPLSPIFQPYEIRAILYYSGFTTAISAGVIAGKLRAGTSKASPLYIELFLLIEIVALELVSRVLGGP